MSMKTVAVIIITSEIAENIKDITLNKYIVKELTSLSYNVAKLVLLPENTSLICHEIELTVKQFDIVIIIGGIKNGTIYKAIEKTFSQELQYNTRLAQILNEIKEPHDIDEISIPIQARLLTANDVYPVIFLQRIFVLKEDHLIRTFSNILKQHLMRYRVEPTFKKIMQIYRNGNCLSGINLNGNGNVLLLNVQVLFEESERFITITAKSASQFHLVEFQNKIEKMFEGHHIGCQEATDMWDNIYLEDNIHIKFALDSIKKCLQQYGPSNVFVSFNGGKDCTVLLHLILTVLKNLHPNYQNKIMCLYVQSENPFPEQEDFINQCQSYYNLEVVTIRSGIKDALNQILSKYPIYKACFMGTRRTDPYSSNLNVFQMTDVDWPQVMRVSPLLDWHYSDIWDYLLYYKVPYCKLYDMGYTSLGNKANTVKNPSLLHYDVFDEKEKYLPAYKLLKETKERHGRNSC